MPSDEAVVGRPTRQPTLSNHDVRYDLGTLPAADGVAEFWLVDGELRHVAPAVCGRLDLASIDELASCGPAATPAPASGPRVSNAAPQQGPACPTPTHAIDMGGSTADADSGTAAAPPPLRSEDDGDDCVRGEVMTVLDAPAAAPHCHVLQWASPRSRLEQRTMDVVERFRAWKSPEGQ